MILKLILHILAATNVALLAICAYSYGYDSTGMASGVGAYAQPFQSSHSGAPQIESSNPEMP
jgi:hypothetical protein